MKASGAVIFVAVLLTTGLPVPGGAQELRPSIPSPGGGWKPVRPPRPAAPKIKPFPGKAINELLAERGYSGTRFVQERLRRILPPGAYKFDAKCPLVKRSPPADPLTREYPMFDIACLDRRHRDFLAMPVAPDKRNDRWKLLFAAPQRERLTGTFYLSVQKRRWDESATDGAGGAVVYSESGEIVENAAEQPLPDYYNYVYHSSSWLWKQMDFRFENPFLRVLEQTAAGTHFDRFGSDDHFERILPLLLKEAVKRSRSSKSDWTEQFLAVVPAGRWLPFYENCPLEVVRPPRRDDGDGRLWMSLRLSCLGKGPFSAAEVLLRENFFRNYPNFAPLRGERFIADLKFGGITRDGKSYRFEWDTINNIRPAGKK